MLKPAIISLYSPHSPIEDHNEIKNVLQLEDSITAQHLREFINRVRKKSRLRLKTLELEELKQRQQ